MGGPTKLCLVKVESSLVKDGFKVGETPRALSPLANTLLWAAQAERGLSRGGARGGG
jgi:hypothetical protein